MDARRVVTVDLGESAYDVVVTDTFRGLGDRLASLFGGRHAVVVTDTNVGPLWLDALRSELDAAGWRVSVVTVPAGETHKHRDTWWSIVDGALDAGIDRKTPIVALGGGVVGDLAGFAAASVLRGVPFVQVPTTLLAMVDSSVGGKTGFNHARGKNLVGAFHQPVLVWAATDTLGTLEPAQRIAGLGEVVKSALIADAELFCELETSRDALREGDAAATRAIIARCVEIKAEVVAADERESGWRAVLNAGHTVGHAFEKVAGYGVLLHGEAVGLGLVAEAQWAARHLPDADPDLADRLQMLIGDLGLPSTCPSLPQEDLVAAMGVDKKASGDMLVLPVCPSVGSVRLVSLPRTRLAELVSELP